MNWQIVVVAVIIAAALLFVAKGFWRKARAFSPKGRCGADCGCETKEKAAG